MCADPGNRRLYIARTGTTPRISVYDLDTLESVSELAGFSAHGAAVDPKTNHGFATSKPVVMWDAKTLAPSRRSTWMAAQMESRSILSTKGSTFSATVPPT
jgi:hypothetical protein